MIVLLLFLVALPLLVFLTSQKYRKRYEHPLPPGPSGLPFIGNLHQWFINSSSVPHLYLWQLSQKYGPLMSLQLGFVPTLVVSSAKMAKEVLKTHDLEFSSRPPLVSHQRLSYNGLDMVFAPYNNYWKEMRKICVLHLFSSKRVQSFYSIREDEVSQTINKISKFASESKLTNLSEVLLSLTSSIICRIAFGKRYDDDDDEGGNCERSKFHSLLNEAQAMMGSFFVADHFPFIGWVDRLSGLSTRLEKNFKELDLFYQEIIDQHLSKKTHHDQQEDIVDILLQLQKDQSFAIDLTLDHIKAVLMNIFVAGTDTSAATLVWAMAELMKNPRVMKRVQEEVRDHINNIGITKGKDTVTRTICEDDVERLAYLKSVVKEILRLHPADPLLVPHETTQQCYIDGYVIRPKTTVYVNAWAIGRDPECWENPEEFYPERFLDSSIDYKGQDFELIPFGAGRRGCPGIQLGVVTVELALANLLYSFDWELPPHINKAEDIDMDVLPGITTHKKNALCLLPKKYVPTIYGPGACKLIS